MKFTVEYPVAAHGYDPELITPEGMTKISNAADVLGFDAIAFTEHPAPTQKWLESGGHESLDLIAALGFCAGQTRRIRLMTYLLVVPYHNPFVVAKSLSTLDRLSSGRVTVVAGTGYLKSEFKALGVDMEDRNSIFDEALDVIRGAWTTVPLEHRGTHFEARGVASVPGPIQIGGPPIWIGGNSALSRRRAARHQGWSPLMSSPEVSKTTRTPSLSSIAQLGSQIEQVRSGAIDVRGEGASVTVQIQSPECRYMRNPGSVEKHRDHLGQLAEAGVDSFVLQPPGDSVELVLDRLNQYAADFLAP